MFLALVVLSGRFSRWFWKLRERENSAFLLLNKTSLLQIILYVCIGLFRRQKLKVVKGRAQHLLFTNSFCIVPIFYLHYFVKEKKWEEETKCAYFSSGTHAQSGVICVRRQAKTSEGLFNQFPFCERRSGTLAKLIFHFSNFSTLHQQFILKMLTNIDWISCIKWKLQNTRYSTYMCKMPDL